MTEIAYDSLVRNFVARNQAVEDVIASTAQIHALVDGIVDGAAGLSPIPGTQIVVLAGQLTAQMTLIYPPMIKRIAELYGAEPDFYTKAAVAVASAAEGVADGVVLASDDVLEELSEEVRQQLSEFGTDFLSKLILEAPGENVGGLLLAQVPFIGAAAGAGVAALLAWTLTWRVGLTVSTYFQNGGRFVGGTRAATTKAIKDLYVHSHHPTSMTGTVNRVRVDIAEVRDGLVNYIATEVAELRGQGWVDHDIRSELLAREFPADLLDGAFESHRTKTEN